MNGLLSVKKMGAKGSPDRAERVCRTRGKESLWSPLSQGEDLKPSPWPPYPPKGRSPLCAARVASFQVSGHTDPHSQQDDLSQTEMLSEHNRIKGVSAPM